MKRAYLHKTRDVWTESGSLQSTQFSIVWAIYKQASIEIGLLLLN